VFELLLRLCTERQPVVLARSADILNDRKPGIGAGLSLRSKGPLT
jgi:hypothetical protein